MNNISDFICKIPKAELHLHIEGTFEPEQMFEFAARNYIAIEYKNIEELRNAYKFNNLQEFLDIYYAGAYVLQNEIDFYEMTLAYLKKASEQNIVHTEIFFDPQTHLHNGIPFDVFFNGIYRAVVDAEKMYSVHTGIIMCFLRHLSEESAFETLELSLPFRDKIIGVGLDSSEMGNPPEKFSRVFEKARELGFLTVAHAGEEGPVSYIYEALELLKIDRIDHGNNSKDSEPLMDEIAKKRIPLTMCPLSNLKLAVVKDLKDHPLKKFLDKNIAVTINSDDPAYFGGYLNENLIAIQQALNLTHDDIIKLIKNSFEASFISKEQKANYLQLVDDFVANTLKTNPLKDIRHIKNLTAEQLADFVREAGEQPFRAKQIYEWVWKKRAVSFDEMTNISASFRAQLSSAFICNAIKTFDEYVSTDGTRKYAFHLTDGHSIESVLIPSATRVTACISTQVGCALGCEFCATGQLGLIKNLEATEIHDQIIMLMKLTKENYNTELDNIVAMGMGEPLLNYENVLLAFDKISAKDLINFSPQRITISTAGIVGVIKQMADENVPYHLAISLHTAIETKRRSMMPVANKYSLVQLTEALKYYHSKTNNRITIEYILFDKINDAIEDAQALAVFCRNFPVKINIIPYNSTSENIFRKSKADATAKFIDFLKSKNIIVNLRASKGSDIMAACGQLALNQNKK